MSDSLLEDQALVFYGTVPEFQDADCSSFLSEAEIARAEQYLVPADKSRFIVSRAILKRLLSRFSGMNVEEIELDYGKNGKPYLRENPDLKFNVSHSDELFVIALALGIEIGIDVENRNRNLNISALERFLFTPSELKLFQNTSADRKQELFIRSWTRKEAVLKASGDGLTRAMNALEIAFENEKQFTLDNQTNWFLESYTLPDHYHGAVAVRGHVKDIQYVSVNASVLEFNEVLK